MAIYIVFFWLHSTDDRGHLPVIIPAEVGGKVFCCYIFFGGPKMTPDTDSVETVLTRKPRGFPKVPWDFSHLRELMFFCVETEKEGGCRVAPFVPILCAGEKIMAP